MSIEAKILEASLCDRAAHETIVQLVQRDTMSEYGNAVLDLCSLYYKTDTSSDYVDRVLLEELVQEKYPRNHAEVQVIVDSLGETSPQNVIKYIQDARRKALSADLAQELVSNYDSDLVYDLWAELNDPLLIQTEEVPTASDILDDSLFSTLSQEGRIRLYPSALDSRLEQGARKQNHVVVFARPGVGKTAFLINLTRGLLRDGRSVLYLCNEEPSSQVLTRTLSRILRVPSRELYSGMPLDSEVHQMLDQFTIKDIVGATFRDIHSLAKRVKPDVLIIDQLRNMRSGEDNRVLQLEQMARAAREVAQVHDLLCISVTQAGDSARDKLYLDDGDIDYSNTGIPGAADLIIGMGCDPSFRDGGKRMLTIVKNKMGTDHTSFPVSIDESTATILSYSQ